MSGFGVLDYPSFMMITINCALSLITMVVVICKDYHDSRKNDKE